ncbi:hypothetical protein KY285_035791 [Solanum tuberosum]|nr:hypothetical protein KY285_035791 [Solanum tuberosum]
MLPDDRFRPPDPSTVMHTPNIHPLLSESSSASSYNSSQVREEAIHTAMTERELDGTHTHISMEDSCQIQGKGAGEKDSQFQDRHNNPHNFTVPVERNTQAMVTGDSSQRRHQNRSNIDVIRDDSVIGDCNMGRGGHNVEAASSSQGGMVGAGDSARIPATNLGNLQNKEEMEIQHREGKHHAQALGQSSTSHMDEQLIKNQSKNTGIPHIDKSHTHVIPASQIHVNAGNEQRRKENEQIWVAKEQKKNQQHVYQENFPRISSNFDKSVQKVNATNVRYDRSTGNIPIPPKTDPLAAPAPYTVVQTYADRLRYNQAKCDVSITLTAPEITTKQGLPAVLYGKEEVMKDLAATCKYTLIGKFSNTMPKVELIRNNFILQTQLSGGVKIAHFNSRHVYIDLDNELDYNMVWTKQRMSIAGQVMRIQVWTPNFKPAEETPIVPIWISLPELPWHCYNKDFVSGLLSPIGKVLYLDSASIKKTRGSQARLKVQVDLTEKRPPYIWMGYVGEDITDGRWQKIEYDNIPDYCFYCKHQGHLESDCTIRQRDEDKKKKELDNVRNKHTKDKDNNPQQSKGYKESEQKEDNNQHYKQQRDQEHMQYPQDDQWQTQRRRNNNQAQTPRDNTSQADQSTKQAGIINIPTQNTYLNLDMQESSPSLEILDKYKGIKGDSRPQTAATQGQVQDEYNRKSANTGQDNINRPVQEDKSSAQVTQINKRQEVSTGQAVTGIDSMLPTPNPITNIDIIAEVAVGGLDGKGQETPTNLQEGVSKGRGELTHARHEDVDSDPSGDYRAPATPINNQQQTVTQQVTDTGQQQGRFNNKSSDISSKTKREAIKKRQQQSMGKESDVIATDK